MRLYDKKGLDRFNDTSRLLHLIRLGDLNMVRDLLHRGLPLNSFRPYVPVSGLLVACVSGNLDMVKLLVQEFGADLEVTQTAEQATAAGFLVKQEGVSREHVKVLDYLLASGANVNAVDASGCSLLHRAVDTNIIDLLLLYHADPKLKDNIGKDALGCTRTHRSPAVLHYLNSQLRQRTRLVLLYARLRVSKLSMI